MASGDAVDGATRGGSRVAEPDGFSEALRSAIAGSGRSLESLRRRLAERGTPVSIATLSYWQSGRSLPQRGSSLRAVLHLEELLQLPHGHLLDRIGPRRRPFVPQQVTHGALPIDHPAAELALTDLGFGTSPDLVDVTIHDTLDVDEAGVERFRTIRNVVRAVRPGAQRLPALLTIDVPSGERAEFVPVSGCRVGREVSRPDVGVFAAELVLDRPLRLGETAAAEHRVVLPRDLGARHCIEYYLLREVTELMIWVRFSPERLPSRVETYSTLGARTTSRPVTLSGSTSVQHVLHHVGPGVVGIRWDW
ncbi:hypothetical protein SAMN04489867_0142 [Pedococcus dokdonensis]|uniref:Uncharacterized protein n=1 Tax=Pedococcus dokdonensis TaxID=443156 RepID=A0A1H0KY27_9MICO|nr:hypothetical protein [Pedococcus dokdonensis]SDO60838.1 hypothetical protein SAMN04489867_0142 [Pedococcus dokdonensis]